MATEQEGELKVDLLLGLSSEAGLAMASRPAWDKQLEDGGVPEVDAWTVDGTSVLVVCADYKRFRWRLHPSNPMFTLMPPPDQSSELVEEDEWHWINNEETYEGEPPLAQALDLTGGVLVGFDAITPRRSLIRLDVEPGHYLVVPVHGSGRLRYVRIFERAFFARCLAAET